MLSRNLKLKLLISIIALHYTSTSLLAQCPPRSYTTEWDWRGSAQYTFVTRDQNNVPVTIYSESPWFSVSQNNSNINSFRLQNPKDYEPSDGWVLVQREFGTIANPVNHPYFILYNRHSGILRIFVAVTRVIGSFNSAVITLKYQPGVRRTSVLEYHTQNSYQNALDQFTNDVAEIRFPNSYSFDIPYWMHADFVMNYDPCTCNSASQLTFDVKLISSASLVFKANGQIQSIDASGKNGSDQRQAFLKNAQGLIDAGNSFYKSTESGLNNLQNIFPNISYAENPWYNRVLGIGAAAGVARFLVGLAGGNSSPKPMAFNISLNAEGSISETDSHKSVIFETPGSDNLTIVPPTKLNYNNIMGVFTLLNTPQLISSYKSYYDDGVFHSRGMKFKVTSSPTFAINPNSGYDLNSLDFKCAIIFEFDNSLIQNALIDYNNNLIYEGRIGNKYVFRTRYVTSGCISDLSAYFEVDGPMTPNVFLKTIVTLQTNDLPVKSGIFVSNYSLAGTVNNQEFENSSFWPNSLSNIPNDIVVSAGQLNANYGAWNSVSIEPPSLSLFPIFSGTYVGGNSVTIKPGSVLRPSTVIKTGSPNGCSTTAQPSNPSSICLSQSYLSRSQAFMSGRSRSNLSFDSDQPEELEDIIAFPNPASGKVLFQYKLAKPSAVKIRITSLSGNEVGIIVDRFDESGSYFIEYDCTYLAPGVYIYSLETKSIKQLKRLVIVK
jgi:hypothetical protein